MFIVCPSTLYNAHALETRGVPKRMIGRISLIPRKGATGRILARLIFEVQVLRYMAALTPFVVAMFVWPDLALPISQAPIPMLFLIYFVETRVFNMSADKREALMTEAEQDRTLDAFSFNAKRLLTRIAARQNLTEGMLHLVVEQSELARVPVLTLVSVQRAGSAPRVLDLDDAERAMIKKDLFDGHVSEAQLHGVALKSRQNLRSIAIDAADVSAHARMAARMDRASGPMRAQADARP